MKFTLRREGKKVLDLEEKRNGMQETADDEMLWPFDSTFIYIFSSAILPRRVGRQSMGTPMYHLDGCLISAAIGGGSIRRCEIDETSRIPNRPVLD